jgi:hypothetical protein
VKENLMVREAQKSERKSHGAPGKHKKVKENPRVGEARKSEGISYGGGSTKAHELGEAQKIYTKFKNEEKTNL